MMLMAPGASPHWGMNTTPSSGSAMPRMKAVVAVSSVKSK
jgi:hypothetical protein